MLISTKGRYALRVMIALAESKPEHFAPLKEIAAEEGISEKYLESILVNLTKVGILDGLRGKGGGYKLAVSPEELTIGSILKVAEGNLAPVACMEDNYRKCGNMKDCKTRPMWKKLDSMIDDFFANITLDDLVKGNI